MKINAYSNKKAANIFNFFMAEGSFQILAIFYEKFLKMKYFHKSNCFEHIRHIFWIRKKLYEMDTKLLFFVFGTVKLYYIIMQKSVYLKNVLITLQAYYKVGMGVFFSETNKICYIGSERFFLHFFSKKNFLDLKKFSIFFF